MESPKNFKSAHKPAAEQALQGGNVVVPGTTVNPPQTDNRPSVPSGDNDSTKGNVAEPAGNRDDRDGRGNSASQSAPGAVATPKIGPTQK